MLLIDAERKHKGRWGKNRGRKWKERIAQAEMYTPGVRFHEMTDIEQFGKQVIYNLKEVILHVKSMQENLK